MAYASVYTDTQPKLKRCVKHRGAAVRSAGYVRGAAWERSGLWIPIRSWLAGAVLCCDLFQPHL